MGEPGRDLQVELVDVGSHAHLQHVADDELTEHGQHVSPVEQLIQLVRILLVVNSAGTWGDSPLSALSSWGPLAVGRPWGRRGHGTGMAGSLIHRGLRGASIVSGTGAGTAGGQNHQQTCRPPEGRPRTTREAPRAARSLCFQVLTTWSGLPRPFRGSVNEEDRRVGNAAPDPREPDHPTRPIHLPPQAPTCSPAPRVPHLCPTPEVPPTSPPRPPSALLPPSCPRYPHSEVPPPSPSGPWEADLWLLSPPGTRAP